MIEVPLFICPYCWWRLPIINENHLGAYRRNEANKYSFIGVINLASLPLFSHLSTGKDMGEN